MSDELASIRHAIRTPLNHIVGYGEMLLEDAEEAGARDLRDGVEAILRIGKQLVDSVQKLLGQERTEPGFSGRELLLDSLTAPLTRIADLASSLAEANDPKYRADLDRIRTAANSLRELCSGQASGETPAPAFDSVAAEETSASNGRLLVVDDNEANREILCRQLERQAYSVKTVNDGADALAALRKERFDLVLLDIVMPGMNGFEVLERMKSSTELRSTPVIVISALDEMESVVRCIEMGAEDYLPKPFDPVLLRARIGAILRRKHAEKERAQLADTFRLLLESTGEGIYGVDQTGRCTFINRAAVRMLGYPRERMLGQNLHSMLHKGSDGPSHSEEECPVRLSLERGQASRVSDESFARGDGSRFPVEYSCQPVHKDGAVSGAVVTFVDITERKQTEEQLRQAAKLESLGVLAGGIAHDFNNLLTGIMGNASLVFDSLDRSDPLRAMADDIVRASSRAADLTRQMLAFAGKGQFIIKPVDVSGLTAEISDLIRSSIPRTVDLKLNLENDLPPVLGDPGQIQQVVMNLVINAGEAIGQDSSEGDARGVVEVETRLCEFNEEQIRKLALNEIEPGKYGALRVTDNGCGMDEETRKRIFDPFYTTKFTGRGLGLAATLGIVRSHKGAIRVNSRPGEGSTFEVFLPVSTQPHREYSTRRAVDDGLQGKGSILVVDDEELVRNAAKAGLERYGYTVIAAGNGRPAAQMFEKRAGDISLVLLDESNAALSADEAFDAIRAINPAIPIVITSGFNEAEIAPRFAGRRVSAFVQKPYSAGELARKIKQALAGSRIAETAAPR